MSAVASTVADQTGQIAATPAPIAPPLDPRAGEAGYVDLAINAPEQGPEGIRLTPQQYAELGQFVQTRPTAQQLNAWFSERGFGGLGNAEQVARAIARGQRVEGINYGRVDEDAARRALEADTRGEYNGVSSDLDRGVGGVALTIDAAALGLENAARSVLGDSVVDRLNRAGAQFGAHPGGARSLFADQVARFNSMPRNPDLEAAMARASEQPGLTSSAGSLVSDVARNPAMGFHLLAEMAPSFAVGGPVGALGRNVATSLGAGALARSMSAGAGFAGGQTVSQLGPNIANLNASGMPLDEAVNRGTVMTIGQLPGAMASGSLIPIRPFAGGFGAVGNVALQVPIQATGGAVSIAGGNAAAGLETRPQDIGIAAATNAVLSPVDYAFGGYYRRTSGADQPGGAVGPRAGSRREVGMFASRPASESAPMPRAANDGSPIPPQKAAPPPRPVDAPRVAEMETEGLNGPEIVGPPARQIDRIDISQVPPPPPGFVPEVSVPSLGLGGRRGEPRPASELADIARTFNPDDALPRPANRVRSIEEHMAANEGRWQDIPATNERRELPVHRIPNPRRAGETIRFQNVIDAETFLRMQGGLRDDGGELAHLGITNNKPRADVPGEDRLGRILNPKSGLSLDEAAFALWERGYLPHMAERPTVDDLLDVLRASRNGERTVLPEDIDTLDAYHQAQAQRWAVESAAQEGATLSEDPTRPVTMDERQQPPVTAYEDLPSRLDRVGNINLAHIESAEDIGRLLQNVETAFGGFDGSRRGRISHEETEALARELGMTADDLLSRLPGQALNAEQAMAARALLAKSSDEVIVLAQRARGGSEADRAAFAEALLRHAAIQEQVSGAIAEAGRALSSLRAAAKSRAVANRIHEITQQTLGGQNRLEEIADGIIELQRAGVEPGQVNRFAADAIKPTLSDKLVELWYNALLSGPQTHVVNALSNVMTGILQFPEQATAALIGQGRRAVRAATGKGDDFDRVTLSEIGPRVIGYLQGTREGAGAFARTLRTGEVADQVTKVESRLQEAIGGTTGKVVRTPSRLLASSDEFFKAIARRMELAALAARKARSEGVRGDVYRRRVEDLTRNPTDEMMERALDYARYLTFQKPLGAVGSRISAITSDHPWLKLFVPFIRTPTNLFKYTLERSPAALIMRHVRNDLKAGGERRHVAMARMMLGTGLAMTIGQLVQQGIITGGGPASPGAEDLLRADGWQPYSIKIGDTYYSYQRLDPLAMTIGIAADLMDYQSVMTERQSENAAALLVASIINNLGNKTWLSGISDLVEAVSNPEMNGGSFVGRLAGSLAVPTGVNQIARWVDPVQRETRAPSYAQDMEGSFFGRALGSIQNRVPYWSQQLPARRDVFGREMRSEGGAGPDLVSPIWTRAARNDPIIRELLDSMVTIGRPQRFMTVDGERRRLSPEDYGRYSELAGRYIHDDLGELIGSPDWRNATPEDRKLMVRNLTRDARADARADLAVDAPPPPPGFVPEGFVPAQ